MHQKRNYRKVCRPTMAMESLSVFLCTALWSTLIPGQVGSILVAEDDSLYYDNYIKVCIGSSSGLSHSHMGRPWERYRSYIVRYGNCTIIRENLEIVFLDGPDSYDLSFLQSIREVNGYVLFVGNFIDILPLTNLRLIRGRMLYSLAKEDWDGYSLYISSNYKPDSTDVGLKEVHLTSLHEILRGSVKFQGNNLLCYEQTINWNDILGNNRIPVFEQPPHGQFRRQCAECHPNCTFSGRRHCWGEGPDKCQKLTSLACSPNCDVRCFGPSPTQCCDEQCAGGCVRNKTDCWACRHFVKDGTCIARCPGEKVYNPATFKMELNPDARYAYGVNCVKECPEHMLIEDETCVSKCSKGQMSNDNRKCIPCDKGNCPKTCPGTQEGHGIAIAEFSGCTVIDGNLVIVDAAFTHPKNHIKNLSDFNIFESVEEITGYLVFQANHQNLTSLSFLKNLRVVHGRTLLRRRRHISPQAFQA